MSKKEYPVCDRCGSPNVSADAAARWDHGEQEWTITNVFDKGHSCDDCGGECRIEWEEGDYPEALAQQSAAVGGAISIDAHKATLASLVAAVSLLRRGGRKAAPSDAMFNKMLADYEKAIEASRIALAAQPGGPNNDR